MMVNKNLLGGNRRSIFHKFNTTKFSYFFHQKFTRVFLPVDWLKSPMFHHPDQTPLGPGRPRPRAGCRSRPNTPRRPGRFGSSRPGHPMSCYHLVVTNSSPWKITIFNRKTIENHHF
jgi:hypothetical protein